MANFGLFDGRPSGVCHRLLSAAATTNATSVKATPGVVKRVIGTSKAATDRFLKFYDKATAPTVGTDVPIMTILIPPMNALYPQTYGEPMTGWHRYGLPRRL